MATFEPAAGAVNDKAYATAALSLADERRKNVTPLNETAKKYLTDAALKKDPIVRRTLEAFQQAQASKAAQSQTAAKLPDKTVKPVADEQAASKTSTFSKVGKIAKKALFYSAIAGGVTAMASAYVPVFCAAPVAAVAPNLGFCAAAVGPATTFNAAVASAAGTGLAALQEGSEYISATAPVVAERFQNWYQGRGFNPNPPAEEPCTNLFFNC